MKILQNDITDEWIKSLEPLEYVDAESEAMEFEDEQVKDILDEQGILREHLEPAQPHSPHVPTHHPPR